MNRENKRKQYEKGYYKTHACNEAFVCRVCGRTAVPRARAASTEITARIASRACTSTSEPGDRAADCGGIMDPIAVWVRKNGEWAIVHRCRICGALSSNRIAADDNPMKLMSMALKPLCFPPFPIERIRELTALMGGDGALE